MSLSSAALGTGLFFFFPLWPNPSFPFISFLYNFATTYLFAPCTVSEQSSSSNYRLNAHSNSSRVLTLASPLPNFLTCIQPFSLFFSHLDPIKHTTTTAWLMHQTPNLTTPTTISPKTTRITWGLHAFGAEVLGMYILCSFSFHSSF